MISRDLESDGSLGLRLRRPEEGPPLEHLERLLGDLVLEQQVARTSRAVIFQVRIGSHGGGPLALKVALSPSAADDLARFRHEVRLLSEVRHPNVVRVYDFGVLPGSFPFLVMELLSREDLTLRLEGCGWQDLYDVAIQAAAGLAHIHRQGVIHLDLKPQNLGLAASEDGGLMIKILDFGLAQSLRGPLDRRIRGTLTHAAPEILLQDAYDHRADLYSLGMTLFELATGVLPSAGGDLAAIRFHLRDEVPDPLKLRPDMPAPLAAILRRLLQRDPQRRFPSAGKLLIELGRGAGREIGSADLALGEGVVLTSRLVGRDAVLEGLHEALAEARRGRGRAMLLEGREGLGKSRLLREFRLLAAVGGATVSLGWAVGERGQPLGPVLQALRRLGAEVEAEVSPGGEGTERFRVYQRIAAALVRLSQGTPPLVLLLDDLHLAEPETRELVAYLAGEIADRKVLLVATRRPPEEAAGYSEEEDPLRASREISVLRLPPLDPAASARLVDACLGTEGLAAAVYDWIYEHSEGYPFAIQQLLRYLIDERILQYRDGEWKPSLTALHRLGSVPGLIESFDWQRLAARPPAERRILDAAAVIAEPFRLDLVAELLDEPPEASYRALTSLVAAGFLEPRLEAEGAVYGLPHRRLREALYTGLASDQRRDLHRRVAERLAARREREGEGSVAAIADHFWRSGERTRSLPYLLAAAAQASAVGGASQAAGFYGRAAEGAAETGDREGEARARLAQADSLVAAGEYSRALRLYHQLLEAGGTQQRRVEDCRFAARVCLRRGDLHKRMGEHDSALASFESGLAELSGLDEPEIACDLFHAQAEALRELGDLEASFQAARAALRQASELGLERQRANLWNTLALIHYQKGDWRRAGRFARLGLKAVETVGDERLAVKLRNNLGNVLWRTGDYPGALALYRENLAFAERAGDLWGQLTALHNLGILECSRGNWKQALEPLRRSLEIKRRLGVREPEALSHLNLGEAEEILGRWPLARRHYERALKLLAPNPQHPDRFMALARLASLDRKEGDLEAAERRAQEALAGARAGSDRDLLAAVHFQLGLVARDREDWPEAAAHLAPALELAETAGTRESALRLSIALADLALRRSDLEAARHHLARARDQGADLGDRFARGELLVAEARLAIADGDRSAGEELFDRAHHQFTEIETPFEQATTLYEWGLATPQPEAALERLDRASSAFDGLGARGEAKRARGAMERIREQGRSAGRQGRDSVLYEVVKVINSTLDLQKVLDRTMDLVLEELGAERGMVVLKDPVSHQLEVAVSRNLGGRDETEERKLSESVVRQVIDSRRPVLTVDALSDERFAAADSIVTSHIRSILCVPLAIRDRLAGAIYVDHCQSRNLFGERHLEFLLAFADHAATAIENARLFGELKAARERLRQENESLRREILSSHHLGSLIGKSRGIQELKATLERVAKSDSTILIRGESGTGKGLVARIVHAISPRRRGPFIHFNCAALPETLVESELFGHEKGAFTGAAVQKPGRFELAHGGTIFLDEIGKMSPAIQAKLLRVVEDKAFERVGGTRTLRADARLISATNLDLERAIERGEFREDLYYRLNIIPIVLPPLRERREDIPELVRHFVTTISRDLGLPATPRLDERVMKLFLRHAWPGNVRELEAAIHRALVLSSADDLTLSDFRWITLEVEGKLPAKEDDGVAALPVLGDGGYEEALGAYDRQLILAALEETGHRIRETARLLGIARNTLKAKMKRYGIETRT